MFIYTEFQNKEHVTEALHHAKFKCIKFQNAHISTIWDLDKYNVDKFVDMVAEKQPITDDYWVK